MKICICGGGNLGHAIAGFIAAKGEDEVRILTRNPERWNSVIRVTTPDGEVLEGHISRISALPCETVSGADAVMLCLPGFSIAAILREIKPFLDSRTAVGSVVSSTGFYFEAKKILDGGTPLFGFQRVPFIARTTEYGSSVTLTGYKSQISMAVEGTEIKEQLRHEMERMLATPTVLLDNMYDVSLTNSNPLLHPARLFDLWRDYRKGDVYDRVPMFYEEWTDNAAETYIAMDKEFQTLLRALPVTPGSIPTVLDYYESSDALSLAAKLRSIKAFKGIPSPMKAVSGGYVPDINSRYFTEDFPYGLAIIHDLAKEHSIPVPMINTVYEWGMGLLRGY